MRRLVRTVCAERAYRWLIAASVVVLIVEPVLVAGASVWLRHGRLEPAVFFAVEEVTAAVRAPFENPVLAANVVYISFLRGAQHAELYLYTVKALLFSGAIGFLIGLNLASWRVGNRDGRRDRASTWGAVAGGGTGGVGTLLGAAVGAAGCCGVSVGGGGLLMSVGLSYTAATSVGARSDLLEWLAVILLATNLYLMGRRLEGTCLGRQHRGGRDEPDHNGGSALSTRRVAGLCWTDQRLHGDTDQ